MGNEPKFQTDLELELYAALKAVEWEYKCCLCPDCENGPIDGHKPECKLNAALKKARGEE